MRLSVISFTEKGAELSRRTAQLAKLYDISLFTKYSGSIRDTDEQAAQISFVQERIGEWTGQQMAERNAVLFIGACGIAVRAIAPYLTDKLHDSPVLVMDELGNYIIPVLSGHMGGANEIAVYLADQLGAVPVITTATDINRKFAVDVFARRNGLYIVNKEGIARVSAKVLAGQSVAAAIETGHLEETDRLPAGLCRVSYPPEQPVDIIVTGEEKQFPAAVCLRPKEYVIGIGCRKGKPQEEIDEFIQNAIKKAGIAIEQIWALASVEQKSREAGLLGFSQRAGIPFFTYTVEELEKIPGTFHESEFVKKTVGVANVCERAALAACGSGGRLILDRQAKNGMTAAIAKREWRVKFDEE